MIDKIWKWRVLAIALVMSVCFAIPAVAEKNSNEYRLAPVKVSAQKREEDVQDVPLSVDVLTDVAIEQSNIKTLTDLSKIVPNLFMSTSGGSGIYAIVGIRGRANSPSDVDPAATVLVDGVPYDDFYSLVGNLLFDIERVEVLRGPQSSMYGLNSQAGVINVVTKKPGDEPRIKLVAEGGKGPHWDGTWMVGGAVSGPIVQDTLSGGIAFSSQWQDGYIENLQTGKHFNHDRKSNVKGDLAWTPTDRLNVSAGITYTDIAANYGYLYEPIDEAAARKLGRSHDKWTVDVDEEGDSKLQTIAPHLKVDYEFDAMELVSVSTFRNSTQRFYFDLDFTPANMMYGWSRGHFNAFSQELRLQSTDEESNLEWLGGYFFHAFERKQTIMLGMHGGAQFPMADSSLDGNSNAIFGQGTYRMFDKKLGVTLGMRQEWTSRDVHSRVGFFEDKTSHDSQFLPKLAVDYQFTPDAMGYASVAQGWRTGGLNHLVQRPQDVEYKKETSWTYEIGTKTKWLDDRIMFNAAAFYTIYEDYHDLIMVNPATSYLGNVKEVIVKGFEAELEARLTDSTLLSAGFGYNDARYGDVQDPIDGDLDGKRVTQVPDYNGNIALRYDFLDNWYARPELIAVGSVYWDRPNEKSQSAYWLANFRLGYTKDQYEVYLFGENLTNQHAYTQAFDFLGNGEYYGISNTPLRVGVGLNVEF